MIRATTRQAADDMAETLAVEQGATFCVFDDIERCGSKGRYLIVHVLERLTWKPYALVHVADRSGS